MDKYLRGVRQKVTMLDNFVEGLDGKEDVITVPSNTVQSEAGDERL